MYHGGLLRLVHFDPAIVFVYHGFLKRSLICRASLALMFSNWRHPLFRNTHWRICSHEKKRNSEKIKVNFHYIIAEDKKRERWFAAQILISHRLVFCWFFLPWLINKRGIQTIWNFCVECLVYLPVVLIKRKFSFQVCLVIKNVKRGRWLPSWMADTIYQTDFNLNTI